MMLTTNNFIVLVSYARKKGICVVPRQEILRCPNGQKTQEERKRQKEARRISIPEERIIYRA
jgi:hypothetical protein